MIVLLTIYEIHLEHRKFKPFNEQFMGIKCFNNVTDALLVKVSPGIEICKDDSDIEQNAYSAFVFDHHKKTI